MKSPQKTLLLAGVTLSAWLVLGFTASAETTLSATNQDLTAAGFTVVKQENATTNRFAAPNLYFRVKEVSAGSEWKNDDSADVLAILILPVTDKTWAYNNGLLAKTDLNGRTQITFSRPGYYVSIVGPNENKVSALANILKNK